MPEELTIADIQQAFFEYYANFKEPIAPLWYSGRHGEVINALHRALSPWRVDLADITWNQGARNLREAQLTFNVSSLFAFIHVSIGGLTMNALNPDWSRVPLLISLFQAGLEAVKASTGQEIESQQTTLGFHVKPGPRPFREALSQFVNATMLGSEDAKMFGVSAYHADYAFVIDGSTILPDGVFIKLIRVFGASARFEEMATKIHEDEERVLHRLGLKLQ